MITQGCNGFRSDCLFIHLTSQNKNEKDANVAVPMISATSWGCLHAMPLKLNYSVVPYRNNVQSVVYWRVVPKRNKPKGIRKTKHCCHSCNTNLQFISIFNVMITSSWWLLQLSSLIIESIWQPSLLWMIDRWHCSIVWQLRAPLWPWTAGGYITGSTSDPWLVSTGSANILFESYNCDT